MSVSLFLLPVFVAIALCLGLMMFFDVAFYPRVGRARRRRALPLREGRDLRDWAAIQGRIVAEQWLKSHPGPVDGAGLARELEQASSEIVTAAFRLPTGRRKGAQRCLDPHGTPRVSVPEALAIVQELRQHGAAEIDAIRRHVSENLATRTELRPDGAANLTCPLATAGGMCVCSLSRPLPCRGRCVAGYDDTPSEAEAAAWAQTLGDGLITGACEALEPLGLDAGRYDLNRAMATLLEQPEAETRWRRGERILAVPPPDDSY